MNTHWGRQSLLMLKKQVTISPFSFLLFFPLVLPLISFYIPFSFPPSLFLPPLLSTYYICMYYTSFPFPPSLPLSLPPSLPPSLPLQILGNTLAGACTDYQAVPGKGLSCTVSSLKLDGGEGGKDENTIKKFKRNEIVSASKSIGSNEEYKV